MITQGLALRRDSALALTPLDIVNIFTLKMHLVNVVLKENEPCS